MHHLELMRSVMYILLSVKRERDKKKKKVQKKATYNAQLMIQQKSAYYLVIIYIYNSYMSL